MNQDTLKSFNTFGAQSDAELIDPVQVTMQSQWEDVGGVRCIQHDKLRDEISAAFAGITQTYAGEGVMNAAIAGAYLKTSVLRKQGSSENYYRREHAKLFSEYVVMQLCSSMGASLQARKRNYDAITRAEKVLTTTLCSASSAPSAPSASSAPSEPGKHPILPNSKPLNPNKDPQSLPNSKPLNTKLSADMIKKVMHIVAMFPS